MKLTVITAFFLFLVFSLSAQNVREKSLSEDEQIRVKLSVHLITCDTLPVFEKASGEAFYMLVLNAFRNNLYIPQFVPVNVTVSDQEKTEALITLLRKLRSNPPTWKQLHDSETLYQSWYDKVSRRKSKYKAD